MKEVTYTNGSSMFATGSHEVHVRNAGWVKIKDLKKGMLISSAVGGGEPREVLTVSAYVEPKRAR